MNMELVFMVLVWQKLLQMRYVFVRDLTICGMKIIPLTNLNYDYKNRKMKLKVSVRVE
jgi:hypothetical protein